MQSAESHRAHPTPGIFTTLRARVADFVYPEGRERRERAEREADFDALTGVANFRAFERALPEAERDPATAVVVFDANNFGRVNKVAGKLAGDAALREVARAIFTAASAHGYGERVFRIGGDEFAVLCSFEKAESIRNFAEVLFGARVIHGVSVSLSGTFGASLYQADSLLQARKAEAKRA
jgi:diguanylate cyclase (GGDEF)-like protein